MSGLQVGPQGGDDGVRDVRLQSPEHGYNFASPRPWAIVERYVAGELALHVHGCRPRCPERKSQNFSFTLYRPPVHIEVTDRAHATDCEALDRVCHGDGVQLAVLVNDVQFVQHPERIGFWGRGQALVWLQTLDACRRWCGDVPQLSLNHLCVELLHRHSRVVTHSDDGELNPPLMVGRDRASGILRLIPVDGQRVGDVIKRGSEVMDGIPDHERPLVARRFGDLRFEDVLAGLGVELLGEGIRVALKPPMDRLFEGVDVGFSPVELVREVGFGAKEARAAT